MATKKTRAKRVPKKKTHKRAAKKKTIRARKQPIVRAKSPRAKTKSAPDKRSGKKQSAARRRAPAVRPSPVEREPIRLAQANKRKRIVLLFGDDFKAIPQTRGFEDKPGNWKLLRGHGADELAPIFSDVAMIDAFEKRARAADEGYRWPIFRNSFFLYLKPGSRVDEVVRILRSWREIRWAYEDADPVPAQAELSPSTVVCNTASEHLGHQNKGVNAQAAWDLEGGLGEDQICADLEQGWVLHQRLAHADRVELLCGEIIDSSITLPHGTAVLGILVGSHAFGGCQGIAPETAAVRLASWLDDSNTLTLAPPNAALPASSVYDAFIKAESFLYGAAGFPHSAGGVLLIEHQHPVTGLPIEIMPLLRAVIRGTTQQADGVTVVEPAGNSGSHLDNKSDVNGDFPFSGQPGDDSGAIMVGSATKKILGPNGEHRRLASSNFGRRVDCYAWGQGIRTPTFVYGAGNSIPAVSTQCTNDFTATSGAAAIIAGVALLLQGIAAAHGFLLSPAQLRSHLRNPGLGTGAIPPATKPPPAEIGSMPDLGRILATDANGFSARFGVYLRKRQRS